MQRLLFLLFVMQVFGYGSSPDDSIIHEYRKPNLGIYFVEGSASFFIGNVVGIGVPILLAASFPLGDDPGAGYFPSLMYFLSYPVIYPFASALAINATAKIFKCPSSFWGAVGGGFLGVGFGIGSCILLRDESTQLYGWSLMAILPPLCATTGYNLFKKKNSSHSNSFLHNKYISDQFYSTESIFITKSPKVSIKILEIRF